MGWITAALGAVKGVIDIVNRWTRSKVRAAAEKVGAIKQKQADIEHDNRNKEEQLNEAKQSRPGDGIKAAEEGDF